MVTFNWYNLDDDNVSRELNVMMNLKGFGHLEMFVKVLNMSLLEVKYNLKCIENDISYCKNYDAYGRCDGKVYRFADSEEIRHCFLNRKILENGSKTTIEMLKIIRDIYLIYKERLRKDIDFLNINFFLVKRKNI